MKLFYMLCLLAGLNSLLPAQTLIVLDDQTGRPVELAVVTASNIKSILITDANGEVNITPFRQADTIEIRSIGYRSIRSTPELLDAAGLVVRLQKEQIRLGEIVVAASRWNQALRDVPAQVATIGELDIVLERPQTMGDLLASTGQIHVQKSQYAGGSPMIRGFATNRLLYAVDGVRMNSAIFRAGNIQNVINLDPFATEQVEIVFGPGSVMYGSDAIGGVMSFQTLTPRLAADQAPALRGKAVLQTSYAAKEFTGHFDVMAGWKKWALATSFTSFRFGDLRMGSHGPDDYLRKYYTERQDGQDAVILNPDPLVQRPSGYGQVNFMQKIRFRPNDRWDFQYAFHFSETDPYARYDRLTRTRNGLPRYGEWSYGPQRWLFNQLSATNHMDRGIYSEATGRLGYQNFPESRFDRTLDSDERRGRFEEVDAWSANLDFLKKLDRGITLYYGLEGVINHVQSTGTDENIATGAVAPGPSRYPQADWFSYGAYGQAQKRYDEHWMVQAGARYSYYGIDAVFDTTFYPFPYTDVRQRAGALTGSLGTTYMPSDRWTFRVNLSSGFRAPNVDDMGKVFDSEPGSVILPNPNLKSEYAWNADLGAAWRVIPGLTLNATAYYIRLDRAMVRRPDTFNGRDSIVYDGELSEVMSIQNAAWARVFGIQAGVEADLGAGFYLEGNLSYQHGEEELDDQTVAPLRHAPPMFGKLAAGYRFDRLMFEAYWQFSAKKDHNDLAPEEQAKTEIYPKDVNGLTWSPAWNTLNVKASYSIEGKFTLSGGIENITDRRYRTYSSGITAPGRNVMLSLQVAF